MKVNFQSFSSSSWILVIITIFSTSSDWIGAVVNNVLLFNWKHEIILVNAFLFGLTKRTKWFSSSLSSSYPQLHKRVLQKGSQQQQLQQQQQVSFKFLNAVLAQQQLGEFVELNEIVDKSARRVIVENWVSNRNTSDFIKKEENEGNNYHPSHYDEENDNSYIDFEYAWKVQRDVVLYGHLQRLQQERISGVSSSSFLPSNMKYINNGNTNQRYHSLMSGIDTVILLEHKPIYTLGTGSDEKFILNNQNNIQEQSKQTLSVQVPTIRMDRGGEVTYHGPGQITIYPIIDLRYYKMDIHWYVRALEESVIVMINKYCFNNTIPNLAYRDTNVTGVWINNTKIAAIGIKCKQWITQHGIAININNTTLDNFNGIVPCGLINRQVSCINYYLQYYNKTELSMYDASVLIQLALQDVFRIKLIDLCNSNNTVDYDITDKDTKKNKSTRIPDLDVLLHQTHEC